MKRTLQALTAALVIGLATGGGALARPIGAYTTHGAWSFFSAPGLHPPRLHTDKPVAASQLASGDFLTASFYNVSSGKRLVGQSGPLMLDNHLQPVWFQPVPQNVVANNLAIQTFNGKPALSWWQGTLTGSGVVESGEYVVVDQHYRQLATLTGQGGWVLSLHDLRIVGHDAWVTAYKTLTGVNLTPYGGPASGSLLDVAAQEYDLTTGQLLKSWDAFNPGQTPNVPLSESKQPAPKSSTVPWDAYHINSIQPVGSSELLVSMRDTWSVYLVNTNTGAIVWTLSGNPALSSFKLPRKASFHWQHDATLTAGNVVSVYDDACCAILGPGKFGSPSGQSRGLVLKLNLTSHKGSLVAQYPPVQGFLSATLGSTQVLPGGNVLVGWGSPPFFSEFSRSGKLLLDAMWPGPDLSYRVTLSKWVGEPAGPPSGAARKARGGSVVYASWNGATRVTAWRVLGGSTKSHLSTSVAHTARSGFETAITVRGGKTWFEVQALDSHGHVLGTSKVFKA